MKAGKYILLAGIFFSVSLQAKQRKWLVDGYVKQMQTNIIAPGTIITDHLLHHRLNFTHYTSNNITIKAGVRDRILYGDLTQNYELFTGVPYSAVIDGGNDALDMSLFLVKSNQLYWHLLFDRAYIEYVKGDWEVRAGRQRINWGINTFWNPHDIFNAFNFFDFDYEERPGSDAIRIKKYKGINTSYEFALKYFDSLENATAAFLYRTTLKQYDLQTLLGVHNTDIVIGGGWAGYIKKKYGFKGELSYFQPYQDLSAKGVFVASLGTDFRVKKKWLTAIGVLYNEQRSGNSTNILDLTNSNNISAKNLSGQAWNILLSTGREINSRLSWNIATMYTPLSDGVLLANTFTYSIKNNWDFDLINQVFGQSMDAMKNPLTGTMLSKGWRLSLNSHYLRLKISY